MSPGCRDEVRRPSAVWRAATVVGRLHLGGGLVLQVEARLRLEVSSARSAPGAADELFEVHDHVLGREASECSFGDLELEAHEALVDAADLLDVEPLVLEALPAEDQELIEDAEDTPSLTRGTSSTRRLSRRPRASLQGREMCRDRRGPPCAREARARRRHVTPSWSRRKRVMTRAHAP